MRPIYLDYNATSPLLPDAADAMRRTEMEGFGNPSSAHHAGRKARQALEDARECIAALLGAQPDEVTFTSGATEANNIAVLGLAACCVITSYLEHTCVVEPLRYLEASGIPVEWLPVDRRGVLDSRLFAPRLTISDAVTAGAKSPIHGLACVMLANHETGAIQSVGDIARSLPEGFALHCDATQAVGKIPVNLRELGATTLAASAHKFGGPKGIGILVTKRDTKLQRLMFGGHQQQGRRPGTEAVSLVVGMATALEHATRNMAARFVKLAALRARMWEQLQAAAAPVVLNGPEIGAADVVPTTLNVSFPGCRADLLLMALDLACVACSTGSACSSGSLLPSPVLRAMGIPDDVLRSALRFSFSPMLEIADIDEASERIAVVVHQMRESSKID